MKFVLKSVDRSELQKESINPTKYQIHKQTKISYQTLNKYYDEIIQRVRNG